MVVLKKKNIYKYLVTIILFSLYFLQVNIAVRIGISRNIFNYFILAIWALYMFMFTPKLSKHKTELYILITSIIILAIRYYLDMFEETVQTLFVVIFPALLYMMIVKNENDVKLKLYIRKILIAFYVINSCMAILEYITRSHVIGWIDIVYSEGFLTFASYSDFRAVALAGAPLTNALLTTILNIYILFSNIREKNKYILFCLGLVAVMAFNARTAIVITVFSFGLYYIKKFSQFNLGKRFFSLVGLFFIVLILIYIILNTSMGSRLFNTESFENDDSIAVRLKLFEEIGQFDFKQFLWGNTLSYVRHMMQSFGVLIIENFWICYILHLGIIVLIIITFLYFKLARCVIRGYGRYGSIVIALCFIILASSNNSLYSGYTPLFTFLLGGYAFNPLKNKI